jgi:prevent-host-death family protein
MSTVGSFEAKTHLPQLLERVSRGERILITKHGRPVAMLVPPPAEKADVEETVQKLLEFGKGRSLDGVSIREMAEEGLRF